MARVEGLRWFPAKINLNWKQCRRWPCGLIIDEESLARMTIKFESSSPVICESVRKGLVDLFPAFDVDEDGTRTFLEKARSLVCRAHGVLNDPYPLSFLARPKAGC